MEYRSMAGRYKRDPCGNGISLGNTGGQMRADLNGLFGVFLWVMVVVRELSHLRI